MDPRAERTIDELVRAAEQLFSARPVAEVTLEEIATTAGVAVSSVYNHFGSKAGLYASVVERALTADREFMDRAYTEDRSPIEQLYAAAEEYLAFYVANPEYFRMLAFPADPGRYAAGRNLADRLAASVDQQNARMVEALRRGIASGHIRPVDPEDVATVLWAAWNGVISLGWRSDALHRSNDELSHLIRVATETIAKGLLAR
jgi:AcrR family transcriptional regulator